VRVLLRNMPEPNTQLIRDGRIDIAFMALPVESPNLVVSPILKEGLAVVMARNHRLALFKKVPVPELANEPCILFPRHLNAAIYDLIVGLCRRSGFVLNIVHEIETINMAFELVGEGLGICVVRASTGGLHRTDVVIRPLQNSAGVDLGIVYDAYNHSSALPLFIETVKLICPLNFNRAKTQLLRV
jgi:DNA-binding transcriptional LysR family regulator